MSEFDTQAHENLELIEKAEGIIELDKVELRAQKNRLYKCVHKIIDAKLFNYFITICIIMNTAVLALDKYPIEKG